MNAQNDSITLSLEDSFFLEKGKEATVEDYFKNIDERVNIKIAQGMKQAMHLIIKKLDILIQNRLKLMVKDEVKTFAADFKCQCPSHSKVVQFNGINVPSMPALTQASSAYCASPDPNGLSPNFIGHSINPIGESPNPISDSHKHSNRQNLIGESPAPNPDKLINRPHERNGSVETLKSCKTAKSIVSDSELFVTKTPTLGARLRDDDRDHLTYTQGPLVREGNI